MSDFLLELRSEEIPARMQGKAREDLARLFAVELAAAGLIATATRTYVTPRRLVLIAEGLPDRTEAVREEVKGPKTGAPPQALEGFLRKTGLTRDQLVERDGVLFAVTERPGRATAEVLAAAIPAIVRGFPWPKAMRWGAASASTESPRWVRPLQGIVALFGGAVVACEVAGIASGAATVGHRFHHPGPITIGSADDYVEKLRACHVIVDQDERAATIREGAQALAAAAGLTLIADEPLVAENAGLTEWPVPLLGRFDPDFLAVPPEVIQLTARVNQKYFVAQDAAGNLADAFICVANIAATDGGAKIVEGNRKVLAARLADARFFYDTDLKVPLDEQARKLDKIVFHERLGTVADKVDRVAKLARWLVEEGIVPDADPALAERAARLCKADLVTGMVGEFPELQGLIGGYYAAAQGEDPAVAAAVRDHYKPVGQGDAVPADPVTVAVSLADKLDTLVGFYANRLKPTGSRDPFALRRAALAVNSLVIGNDLRASVASLVAWSFDILHAQWSEQFLPYENYFDGSLKSRSLQSEPRHVDTFFVDQRADGSALRAIAENELAEAYALRTVRSGIEVEEELLDFFADRLKVQQREAGVRHDLIDAVFALGGEDDLVRLLARVRALQAFVGTDDGANLLAGYKRAANILKKEGFAGGNAQSAPLPDREGLGVGRSADAAASATTLPTPDPSLPGRGKEALSYTPEPAETALIAALDAAEPAAAQAVAREDFEAAMTALATLRAPIDAFFEGVTVNDPDPAKRAARLALLARVRAAVHTVADFSKIEG